jgi:hypothetical protein
VLTPPLHFRIVKRLADYQFFRAGGMLVGTHAFLALGNQLGVAWGSGTRTLDLDFAHQGRGGNVDVALPANLRVDTDDALKSLQIGFLPALGGSKGLAAQYASQREPGLRIDFLTAKRRSDQPLAMPDLGVSLEPLRFMEYLMEGSGQGLLLDREDAIVVNLPDPARYGLHKLLVAYERGPSNPKHDKDILQALALIEWHLARAPNSLKLAWEDLLSRGPGWGKRGRESLKRVPDGQRELVGKFLAAMKTGK